MDVVRNFLARYEQTREEEMSLEDYLDLCKRDPLVYATAFSGFYWAMLAVLWALFFRPVGFDYRSKIHNATWRSTWDWGLFIGGAVPPLIFGVAFGNLLQGDLGASFRYADWSVNELVAKALIDRNRADDDEQRRRDRRLLPRLRQVHPARTLRLPRDSRQDRRCGARRGRGRATCP